MTVVCCRYLGVRASTPRSPAGVHPRPPGLERISRLAAVTFWKAIHLSTPWVRTFLYTGPRSIREATTKAFLPGLGDKRSADGPRAGAGLSLLVRSSWRAIPSTLLCCWDPEDFDVTDERAREGLALVGVNLNGLLEYWKAVRSLRDRHVDSDRPYLHGILTRRSSSLQETRSVDEIRRMRRALSTMTTRTHASTAR